jgi:hypothetical protein
VIGLREEVYGLHPVELVAGGKEPGGVSSKGGGIAGDVGDGTGSACHEGVDACSA